MKKSGPFLALLVCSVLFLGVVGCSETTTTTAAAPSGTTPSDAVPTETTPSEPITPIAEQQIRELAAPALGTSAADVDVQAYENFDEWSAAAVFPAEGEAGRQAVFYSSGGTWSLFWLQTYTVTSEGIVEFEDPSTLSALGVPQAVIDWLNLDM